MSLQTFCVNSIRIKLVIKTMVNPFDFRPYVDADQEAVLAVFRANTPAYFSPEEESGLVYFLNHKIEEYYVMLVDHEIIGSGGINFEDDKTTGIISWGMIHPDFQGKYLGSALLKFRIGQLQKNDTVQRLLLRTSQHVYKFYEKQGFQLNRVVKDYWVPGIDLYEMEHRVL